MVGIPELGRPARCPLTVSFLAEGFPTKIDYRRKGTLILTYLLEDLANLSRWVQLTCGINTLMNTLMTSGINHFVACGPQARCG